MQKSIGTSIILVVLLLLSSTLAGCGSINVSTSGSSEQTPTERREIPEANRDVQESEESRTPIRWPLSRQEGPETSQEPPASHEDDVEQPPEPAMERMTANEIAALTNSVLTIYAFDSAGNLFSQGSGFVAFDDRTLVTNYHVIEGAYYVNAISEDDIHYNITGAVYLEPDTDIAVLRFETQTNLPPLPIADSALVQVGDEIYAIGSPQGLKNTLSNGIVSAFREINMTNEIQFTAAISPGSSGGALLNVYGEVVGIPYSTVLSGQNLNFAIPINELGRDMNDADEFVVSYPDETQTAPIVVQPLDFREMVLTEDEKNLYQNLLNELGNPTEGNADVNGFYLQYTDDGGLLLAAFIRNGMNQLLNIKAFDPLTVKTPDGRVIASGNFRSNFGTILPSQSIIWQFHFDRNHVLILDADLSKFYVSFGFIY